MKKSILLQQAIADAKTVRKIANANDKNKTMNYTKTHTVLSDTQIDLLHKIQDYLIAKDSIESVGWIKGSPPVYCKVSQPIKKIHRILHNGYYDEKDKKELNALREFYMLATINVDKSPYYKKQYSDDNDWLNTDDNGWPMPVDL